MLAPDLANGADRHQLQARKAAVRQATHQVSSEPAPPAAATANPEQLPLSPLDRLKARSAQERWKEANRSNATFEAGPVRPVPEPRDLPPVGNVPRLDPAKSASPQPDELPLSAPPHRPLTSRPIADELLAGGQDRALGATPLDGAPVSEPVRDPRLLRKLTSIHPFHDYTPAGAPGSPNPCHNLCPRPTDAGCPACPSGKCPECPEEVSLSDESYVPRMLPHLHYCWAASDLYYNPLYFEDFELERYGHTRHPLVQPFASVGKFSLQILGLPYQATIHPIWECQSPLGYCRPGEFVAFKNYQIPWNTRAALVEGAAAVGAVFFIP